MRGIMNAKIREYIDRLFEDAPKTRKALEMKEEMVSNAEEKFADFISQGYKEEDALDVVINSIGNVEELFRELEESDMGYRGFTELELKLQKKKALFTAISVGLYIFAGAVFFFFVLLEDSSWGNGKFGIDFSTMGIMMAALCCIAPTCLLVYASTMIPKYRRSEDTMVEEYKEWKSGSRQGKEVRKAISSIIWTVTVILYFVISFTTFDWYITWVVFLIAGCVESIVSLIFSMKNTK